MLILSRSLIFDCCMMRFFFRVTKLRNQRALIEDERKSSEKQLNFLKQQISLTEKQQTAAAEAEDFDLADRLATVTEKLSKDVAEQETVLSGIDRAVSHLDGQNEELERRLINCFSDIKTKLKLLHDEQEGAKKDEGNEVRLLALLSCLLMEPHILVLYETALIPFLTKCLDLFCGKWIGTVKI